MSDWPELGRKLRRYRSLYSKPIPPLTKVNTIPDAPICGGGKLTVALDGTHRKVNYYLSKSDFWSVVLNPEALFQRYSIRQAPLCRLALTLHQAPAKPTGFQHTQDMSNAELCSVLPMTQGSLNVRCVSPAQRDFVIYELKAIKATASVTFSLEADNEHDNFFILTGWHDAETVWLRKEHTSFVTVNAAVAMRAVGASNVRPVYDRKCQSAIAFEVHPGKTVRLLLSVKGGKDQYHHLEEAITALEEAGPGKITRLLKEHGAWWRDYWLKSWVDLGDPVLERYYYGAQYVHGCSIDLDGRVVPGLAGGWITSPNPIWGGTYTMNYNGEAPFWGLMSSNRGAWVLPYARVCLDYIPPGRELARRLDTRGMVMPVMIGPWGIPDNDDALGQKSNASLAVLSLIWHYEFSRDREFLEQYAYPLVRALTEYWEDNLTLDVTGRYVIENSAARERTPGDLNPGPELGCVRRVLQAAVEFSRDLRIDQARRGRWKALLERLSDYPTMEVDGGLCFMEAENRMEVSFMDMGDNPVVLDHVYPSGAIDADPAGRGRIIARNTLRYLDSWNQGNGFPRIFSQAVRAEWPGGDLLNRFKARITSGKGPHENIRRNNTFLSADHSYEGSGSTEFLNSMLAEAHSGVLKVFHVWPRDRDASFVRIRVRGAFLVSGELKGGVVRAVTIASEKGGLCRMVSCWPGRAVSVYRMLGRKRQRVTVRHAGEVAGFKTVAGATYFVTEGDPVVVRQANKPVMLVPIIDPSVRARREQTEAALDILFTPGLRRTRLDVDAVFADETRRRCTASCRLRSRDPKVVRTGRGGQIMAAGPGRADIDVDAEIDGMRLTSRISVQVLSHRILPIVAATVEGQPFKNWFRGMHDVQCILRGDGTDGPGVEALHRANSYGHGLFAADSKDGRISITFDFGSVQPVGNMWFWNYNAPDDYRVLWWSGGSALGFRDVIITHSRDAVRWKELKTEGYPFRFARASGKQWMPASNLDDGHHSPVRFHGVKARYVKLAPNPEIGTGNWGGAHFGLSQVRFTRGSG